MSSAEVSRQRHPHAVLDLASRRLKGIKIERLLDLAARPQPIRMLEIGTGSGGIAHYFATHPDINIQVDTVDVVDNRLVTDAYRFQLVSDTGLPFADKSFDVILTNHVIEHVGDRSAQLQHLREVRRVMTDTGVGYLAVPNRWMLIEPHYKLAFLSWWPRTWRSKFLNWRRGVPFYDCEPLTLRETQQLLHASGFEIKNLSVPALRQTLELEYQFRSGIRRFFDVIPDGLLDVLGPAIPTLIYRFEKKDPSP